MTKMEDPAVQNVANHYAVFHIISQKESLKMDNAKLFRYHFASKGKLQLQTVFDIIDYWYEWIFRDEIYERLMAMIYD
jgi:hypothetical protein